MLYQEDAFTGLFPDGPHLRRQPGHQLALRTLGLALTDQFTGESSDRYADAEKAFQQLSDAYERLYYTGLLHERRAKAQLRTGRPAHTVTVLLEDAMRNYEEAERIRPTGKDENSRGG